MAFDANKKDILNFCLWYSYRALILSSSDFLKSCTIPACVPQNFFEDANSYLLGPKLIETLQFQNVQELLYILNATIGGQQEELSSLLSAGPKSWKESWLSYRGTLHPIEKYHLKESDRRTKSSMLCLHYLPDSTRENEVFHAQNRRFHFSEVMWLSD
jgi:hypothetical protein